MNNEDIIKCKNVIKKHGKEKVCDGFIMKRVGKKMLYMKCPSCKCDTVVYAQSNGNLGIIHTNKEEEILCQMV